MKKETFDKAFFLNQDIAKIEDKLNKLKKLLELDNIACTISKPTNIKTPLLCLEKN